MQLARSSMIYAFALAVLPSLATAQVPYGAAGGMPAGGGYVPVQDRQPLVEGGTSAIYMFRDSAQSAPLLRSNAGGPGVLASQGGLVLNADDLEFGYDPGLEVFLNIQFLPGWFVDSSYYWVDDYYQRKSFTATNMGFFVGNTLQGGGGVPATNTAVIAYQSELQSGEINFRRAVGPSFHFLTGFRWLEIDERLDAHFETTPATVTNDLTYQTRNDLFGGQIGTMLTWSRHPLDLQFTSKAAVFGNHARGNIANRFAVPALFSTAQDSNPVASVMGELSAGGTVYINPFWGVRASYQIMWIDGVALAGNQTETTGRMDLMPGVNPMGLNTGGTVVYHGGFVGLVGEL